MSRKFTGAPVVFEHYRRGVKCMTFISCGDILMLVRACIRLHKLHQVGPANFGTSDDLREETCGGTIQGWIISWDGQGPETVPETRRFMGLQGRRKRFVGSYRCQGHGLVLKNIALCMWVYMYIGQYSTGGKSINCAGTLSSAATK